MQMLANSEYNGIWIFSNQATILTNVQKHCLGNIQPALLHSIFSVTEKTH